MFKIRRIKFYNLLTLYFYLAIRYKIFVLELGRSVFKELTKHDVYCNHYVLLLDTIVIGTFRLHYVDNVVELGRVALLSDYRNKRWDTAITNAKWLMIENKELKKYYEAMIERIEELKKSPPEANWDGVFRATSK